MSRSACVLITCPVTDMVLAVSRKDDPNAWGLPGGKQEDGEKDEDTARRELREETGIKLRKHRVDFWPILKKVYEADDCITYTLDGVTWDDSCSRIEKTKEKGRVAWVTWQQLFDGPFGEYNRALYEAFRSK